MPTAERPNPTRSGCLLVLGMHRSGTSALTSTLTHLGLSVGEPSALHPADAGNPSGYWEPAELIQINDALLASWGGSQRSPRLASRPTSAQGLPSSLVTRMSEYARRWDAHVPFVWKDPRLCITLPFWRPLLPIRGVVVAARHPAAVADSLAAREGMSRQAGLVLWEAYTRSLLAALDDTPRLVVRYEDLLERGADTVERLDDFARRTVGGPHGDRAAAQRVIEGRTLAPTNESALSHAQRDLYKLLCQGTPAPEGLAHPEVVDLLDAATRLGEELLRRTFFFRAAEAKIERLRARATEQRSRARDRRGVVDRLRRWAWRRRAPR